MQAQHKKLEIWNMMFLLIVAILGVHVELKGCMLLVMDATV